MLNVSKQSIGNCLLDVHNLAIFNLVFSVSKFVMISHVNINYYWLNSFHVASLFLFMCIVSHL